MQFTNVQNLSKSWFNALTADDYDKVGDYSVTDLIKPPRAYFLKKRHDDKIIKDCADNVWLMLGTAVHYVLEKSADDDAITEQRFTVDIGGIQLSMKPDRVEKIEGTDEYCLKDYKITKVFKYMAYVSYDWFWQFNIYAWGLRKQLGINVTKIELEMLFKDWSIREFWQKQNDHLKNKSLEAGYPPMSIGKKAIKVLTDEEVESFLEKRIALFEKCKDLPDNELPECTEEERWAKPDIFKVRSIDITGKVSDKAVRGGSKFLTRADAEAFVSEQKTLNAAKKKTKIANYRIDYFAGASNRCEFYCDPCKFCNQFKVKVKPAF